MNYLLKIANLSTLKLLNSKFKTILNSICLFHLIKLNQLLIKNPKPN